MGLKVSCSPNLSSWLLGQGSDGAKGSSDSMTRGMAQVDRGEALVSSPSLALLDFSYLVSWDGREKVGVRKCGRGKEEGNADRVCVMSLRQESQGLMGPRWEL